MIPALYNGYPLVYSDTGTYINSGLELLLPEDRPIMYGLFIRLFSLKFSLWSVIYVQSMIVLYCLWHITKLGFERVTYKGFIVGLFVLSSFTGLGWYSSQIMPDIFTFTAVSTIPLLLFKNRLNIGHRYILAFILVLSITVHFSNILIVVFTLFSLVLFFNFHLGFKKSQINYTLPTVSILLSLIVSSSTNFIVGGKTKINQGSHVFLMGKMLDSGVLKSFLDDKCTNNNYILCECKDSLPVNNRKLLWSANSPLYKYGGWEATNEPFNKIIIGIITSPKHLFLYAYNSFFSSLSQLFQNDIGSGIVSEWYREPNSPPYGQIFKHFPLEFNEYIQSRQNGNLWKQELDIKLVNQLYNVLLVICFIFIILYSTKYKIMKSHMQLVAFTLIISLVFNAITVATLANVYDRLQARVSWFIIYLTLLILVTNGRQLFYEAYLTFRKNQL